MIHSVVGRTVDQKRVRETTLDHSNLAHLRDSAHIVLQDASLLPYRLGVLVLILILPAKNTHEHLKQRIRDVLLLILGTDAALLDVVHKEELFILSQVKEFFICHLFVVDGGRFIFFEQGPRRDWNRQRE